VYRSLWILIFLVTALLRSQAAPITVAEIPFQYREGLLWVKVNISKSEKPLNFLLGHRCGCERHQSCHSKRIGLKLGQEVTVHGVETTLTGHWQQRMFAKAGGVRFAERISRGLIWRN